MNYARKGIRNNKTNIHKPILSIGSICCYFSSKNENTKQIRLGKKIKSLGGAQGKNFYFKCLLFRTV